MASQQGHVAARLAIATGVVTLVSVVSLLLFFAVGKPFGAINDWTVGLAGLLSGLLAVALRGLGRGRGAGATLGTGVAVVGAAIVVVGAVLVISERTGFLLAGLVESLGFALIGVWLVSLNWALGSTAGWPRQLRTLGLAAGVVMALGFVVAPGVLMGLDDANAAPGWIWLGFVGWLGIFFLYPTWSLWLGTLARTASMRWVE
jgi:hypothetical protein